jgi:hypothetical protein
MRRAREVPQGHGPWPIPHRRRSASCGDRGTPRTTCSALTWPPPCRSLSPPRDRSGWPSSAQTANVTSAARYAAARSPRRSPRLPAGTAGSPRTWAGTVSRRPSCCCRPETCSAGLISPQPWRLSSDSTPASSCFRTTAAAPGSRCRPRPRCTPRRSGSVTPAGTRSGWWRSSRCPGPSRMTMNAGKCWSVTSRSGAQRSPTG